MSDSKVAIQFSNCLGNFIQMTAALKLLKQDGPVDLITEDFVLDRYPSLKFLAEKFFDGIHVGEAPAGLYETIYTSVWSRPGWMPKVACDWRDGIHEVSVYLEMINRRLSDFDGFLSDVADGPILSCENTSIALSNASIKHGSRRGAKLGWAGFPELSRILSSMGFDVVLLGQGEELAGCVGTSFVDQLSISETSKVLQQCDLLVTTDSGLMHVADSLGVPMVLLMGPSPLTKSCPLVSRYEVARKFISCAPCFQTMMWNSCEKSICMEIPVEDVLKKIFKFNLRKPQFKKPVPFAYTEKREDSSGERFKIVIPYYEGCDRVEIAKKTWLYPEVVFALSDEGLKIPEEHFYEFSNGLDLDLSDRKKPLLNPIMRELLRLYPDNEYYGFFNSDIILPYGVNLKRLLPEKGKVAAIHHRLDLYPNGTSRRYVGKDGFIMTKGLWETFLKEFPTVILGAGGWDGGLFYWLWGKYGEKYVDLRFDEIQHTAHQKGWASADKDTYYNRIQVKPFRFPVDWDTLGAHHANIKCSRNVVKTLGIVQPLRLGDIFIILPIAKWYFDRGYEIHWPIGSEYMWIQDYVNYVKFLDVGVVNSQVNYKNAHEKLHGMVDSILDLGMGIGLKVDTETPFDLWKYQKAKVPFSERQNLVINRNYSKEASLKKHLKLPVSYTIMHSHGNGVKSYDFKVNGVEVKPIPGYTLLDWIGVFEDAKDFYCVDSSIANVLEGLQIGRNHRTLKFNANIKNGFNRVSMSNDWVNVERLPVHFFTLVWNGMPFIKYHLDVLEKLSFDWHWHIIEGPAQHGQDQGSRGHAARGGFVPEVSDDGTIAYLKTLAQHPKVMVYLRQDWKGKVDMANAPLKNIKESCVLWQLDSDELYDRELFEKAYRIFMLHPEKNIGVVGMHQFVGPHKYVPLPQKKEKSIDTWGTHKYPRLFRYVSGLKWTSHAPPTLSFEKERRFDMDILFHHYSYTLKKQVDFKGSYYGYKDFFDSWKSLQRTQGLVMLGDYFPWLKGSNVIADDWNKATFYNFDII